MQKRVHLLLSAIILVASLGACIADYLRTYHVSGNFIYINERAYEYFDCFISIEGKEDIHFLNTLATNIIGIWLPMIIIVIVHIILFWKLRKQSQAMRCHSRTSATGGAPRQLQRISKKFITIVCAFFLCMLPGTIVQTYFAYLVYSKDEKEYNDLYVSFFRSAVQISTSIMNVNSCLNPFIYGQIQLRLWKYAIMPWKHLRNQINNIRNRYKTYDLENALEQQRARASTIELSIYNINVLDGTHQ